jgi:hypothetical protein
MEVSHPAAMTLTARGLAAHLGSRQKFAGLLLSLIPVKCPVHGFVRSLP